MFKFKVNVIESERGWGSKIDETLEFETYEQAEACIREINSKNTEDEAPDLYWRAERANYSEIIIN